MAVAGKRWLSEDSFRDGVALCQSLPGATAMQIAAYCGFRASGFGGAAAAYVGFGLPAFLLMVALSAVYARAQDFDVAVSVFTGLRVMVVAIVANATLDFARTSLKSIRDGLLVLGAAVFMSLGGHPVVAIAAVIAIALLLYRDLIPTSVKEPPISCPAPTRTRNLLTAPLLLALSVAVIMTLLFLADRTLFSIAAVMTKIDLLAFGGGFVSIPLMFHEVVEARHWLDGKTFMDGIALGQVTPGPIVITATFVGYKVAGLPGAVVATVGIFTPSFVVLVAAVPYLDRLQQSALFRRALRGALVCFVGLLFAVTVRFALAAPWSIPSAIIAGLAFVALRFKVDILWVVLAAAAASTILL
jgi:chromate transporter